MFEVPGSEIKGVHITEECVIGVDSPIYIHRSSATTESTDPPEASSNTEEEENRKFRVKQ
jgi:ATP-dependent Clp protease ATP-binding subunit ClpX